MNKQIPVSILTGFLGSGKTTLLNELIQKHPNKKFAIIENEFGDISIDSDLVMGVEEGVFELSNGCICCSMNDDLIQTLQQLLEGKHQFDHLIIETTGIAEPENIAAAFVVDPMIQNHFKLDATICLVDAPHIEDNLADRKEAKQQILFSDMLIINKQGEVAATYLEEIKTKLKALNPFAEQLTCDHGKVDKDILALNAYDVESVGKRIEELHKQQALEHEKEGHVCSSACSHHKDHLHAEDVQTFSFVIEEAIDILKFRHWLNIYLMLQGSRIYRVKGILNFQYQDYRTIVQSVRQMCVFQSGELWEEKEKPLSRIVFIGQGLDKKNLEEQLQNCLFTGTY